MSIALLYADRRGFAEEIVNDCFLKVLKSIHRYDDDKPFKPWLRRIAVNTCVDSLRRENRFKHVDERELAEYRFNAAIIESLDYETILKGLQTLPLLQRLVFNMYEIEGFSHFEISDKLGIRESSSRTYLTRAKKKLQQFYKQLIKERNVRRI